MLPLNPIPSAQTNGGDQRSGHVDIPCAALPTDLRDTFRIIAASQNHSEVLLNIKKRLLKSEAYIKYRHLTHKSWTIPPRAEGLLASLSRDSSSSDPKRFSAWKNAIAPLEFDIKSPSRAKARARAIAKLRNFSLALTLEPQFFSNQPDVDPQVLEVEVIAPRDPLTGRNSPTNHDFYVYDHTGDLATCSTFFSGSAIVIGPSPHACMGCHYNKELRAFTPTPLSFKGAPVTDWNKISVDQLDVIDSCH